MHSMLEPRYHNRHDDSLPVAAQLLRNHVRESTPTSVRTQGIAMYETPSRIALVVVIIALH